MCNFDELFRNAWDVQEEIVSGIFLEFRKFMDTQNEIRIYVEGQPTGTGHVACTCKIIERITDASSDVNWNLGYAGGIEVVWEDSDEQSLRERMAGWFPQLRDEKGAYQIGGASVRFRHLSTVTEFMETGITGGSNIALSAAKMNVKNFLHLEPAWWGFDDCIEINGGEAPVQIAGSCEENSTLFSQRAYVYDTLGEANWAEWKENYKQSVNVISIAEQIFEIQKETNHKFLILPSYIFNTNMATMWLQIMSVLVGSLQYSQEKLKEKALPVVIVDASEIAKSATFHCNVKPMNFWDEVKNVLSAAECENDNKLPRLKLPQKPPSQEKPVQEKHNPEGTAIRQAFFESLKANERFEKYFSDTSKPGVIEDVKNYLCQFLNSKEVQKKVLYLHLGRLPAPVFEYFLAKADLPPLFEGVNTANVAMLYGKPYFHRKKQGKRDTPFYPTMVLGESVQTYAPNVMIDAMRQFNVQIYDWKMTDNPCVILGELLYDLLSNSERGTVLKAYFTQIGDVYRNPVNDKLTQGICMFMQMIKKGEKSIKDLAPLEAWYQELKERLADPEVLLLAAIPDVAGKSLECIMGESVRNITIEPRELKWIEEPEGRKLLLEAGTDSIIWDGLTGGRIEVVFSAKAGETSVSSAVTLELSREELSLPGIPWIVLKHPGFYLELPGQAGEEIVSAITGRWGTGKQELVHFLMYRPLSGGHEMLEARLEAPYRAGEEFYALLGGVNPLAVLPGALSILEKAGLRRIWMQYDSNKRILDGVTLCFTWDHVLKLGNVVELKEISLMCAVTQPSCPEKSFVSVRLIGSFTIGTGETPGIVRVSAQLPQGIVEGSLCEGNIVLSDIWQQFLSFIPNPLAGSEAVTELDFLYDYNHSKMELMVGLNLEWKLAEGFVLKDVGLSVTYDGGKWTGNFGAGLLLFAHDSIRIQAFCSYGGEEQGWLLGAQMTEGTLKIGRLITEFLGWELPEEYDYGLKNLKVIVALQQECYTFYGETAGFWAVPFLPEIRVSNVKASVSVDKKKGHTKADITGEVDFFGVELKLSLDYSQDRTCYGIQWKGIRVEVEKKDSVWTAVLSLSGQTLGGMVETFVQWVSGNSFALASPWNVLNDISLSAFSLVFEFPEQKGESANIHFEINIGPIDLGIAKIESIELSYVTEGTDKGVKIALVGEFFWSSNEIMYQQDGAQKLQWDPAKPEETPAPSGGGNKYFDLRLLAMGQHLKLRDAKEFGSVTEAVNALKVMSKPEQGKLPVGPEGPVGFCSDNDWLIAADFGVLRENNEKGKPATYFLKIAGIFNDPSLYGLHVKLDGKAAQVLKGLEFDIMYRQVSETVGCYSSRITLPELMRRFDIGVFTITMPAFYFEIYTNGDFLVDIGFPHNKDFSSSFSLEGVVAPGIPVMGAAGFYFGKLSSETTDLVPKASNGWFNPVIVFGLGVSIGVGKSLNAGVLKAGFSIMAYGIIEGVIAKWLPYVEESVTGTSKLQDSYYFSLKGSFGVAGNLYGSVDFAIIKASVNVMIRLDVSIVYESCQPIPITVMALVDVRLQLEINLWLFTIKIHLSFALKIKETLVLGSKTETPWKCDCDEVNRLTGSNAWRLQNDSEPFIPCFGNLKSSAVQSLQITLAPAMSVYGDEAKERKEQRMCYVPLFFLSTREPVYGKSQVEVAGQFMDGRRDNAKDDFEKLAIQTVFWLIAAGMGPMEVEEVKDTVVSEAFLKGIAEYLSDPGQVMPLRPEEITQFLAANFQLDISLPSDQTAGEQSAVVFPAVPELTLLPDGRPESGYRFADYNEASFQYLEALRVYFSRLAVMTQEEEKQQFMEADTGYSVASYVFADYFVMLASQMIRGMLDGLRCFLYLPKQGMSAQDILEDIRKNSGGIYNAEELLDANGDKRLRDEIILQVCPQTGATYITKEGDTLRTVCDRFDISFRRLASDSRNLQIRDMFTLDDEPYVSVPHLPAYRVGALVEECVRGLVVQRAGAMMSRYQLHGLRLPTKGIVWKAKVVGADWLQALPEEMGLFALMGQMVVVPEKTENSSFCFALEKGAADWITFHGDEGNRLSFLLEGKNYRNMCRIKEYVDSQHFARDVGKLERGASPRLEPAIVSLGSSSGWTAAGEVVLPCGQGDGRQLKLWKFTRELKAMVPVDGSLFQPHVIPVKSRFDEVKGGCVETPVEHFGTGTLVSIKIRKVSTPNSFEILSVGSEDAVLLERMVSQLQQEGDIGEIVLLYDRKHTGAYCSDAAFGMGITHTNLSTATRPSFGKEQSTQCPKGLLQKKINFVQLLWEAAIIGNGGFYLHYYNSLTKESLPDGLFNERGEAEVAVLALSPRTQDNSERIRPYGNVVITDGAIRQENMLLKTVSVSQKVKSRDMDSLDSLVQEYYGDAGAVAGDNSQVPLQLGIRLTVVNALYQTGKRMPGRNVEGIAKWFGTTVEELKKVNPLRKDWPRELPLFTALRLPVIFLEVRKDFGRTINEITDYYGITSEQFASCNGTVKNLFPRGSNLVVRTGPCHRVAMQTAGTGNIIMECPVPPENVRPGREENTDGYAEAFLGRQFQMLSYSIAENEYFSGSTDGIPVGPMAAEMPGAGEAWENRLYSPAPSKPGEYWKYDVKLAYGAYVKGAAGVGIQENIYEGQNRLLQIELNWQDIFGNRMINDLEMPGERLSWNRSTQLTGYVDPLYGVSRWPYAGVSYWMEDNAVLSLQLTFDASHFEALEEQKQEVEKVLETYHRIWMQLTDPNTVAVEWTCSMMPLSDNLLTQDDVRKIHKFIESIMEYLSSLLKPGASPLAAPDALSLYRTLKREEVNKEDLFELKVWLGIRRNRRLAAPGMDLSGEIWNTVTELLPDRGDNGQSSIDSFASQFYRSFLLSMNLHVEIAEGVNRLDAKSDKSTLWVVRLGREHSSGIHIYRDSEPALVYAPKPLSTSLISLQQVPIYEYNEGEGIDFHKPSHLLDFADIDLDVWMKSVLETLDDVLSPSFTLAAMVLDWQSGSGYLDGLLLSKRKIAEELKNLALPVFEDEKPKDSWLESIRETYLQEILEELKSVYDIQALIQFPMQVDSGLTEKEIRLFGNFLTEGEEDAEFSSAKLKLAQTRAGSPEILNVAVTGGGNEAHSHLRTEPVYDARYIEHQIEAVPGIEGYKKSSWLHFMRASEKEEWPLKVRLGTVDIPFVLRQFPKVPTLWQQEGTGATKPGTHDIFERACLWDYSFTYQGELRLQDTIYARVDFNARENLRKKADRQDMAEKLAQFVTVYPKLARTLEEVLPEINSMEAKQEVLTKAQTAMGSLVEMVDHLAESMKELPMYALSDGESTGLRFTIWQKEKDGIFEMELEPENTWEGHHCPIVNIEGWKTEAQEERGVYRFRKEAGEYMKAEEALEIPRRSILFTNLHIGSCQSAKASLYLKRNENLVEERSTAGAFVYRTQETAFAAPTLPRLVCRDVVNIANIGAVAAKRTLDGHLEVLLDAVKGRNSNARLRLEIHYSYLANITIGARVRIPVLLIPGSQKENIPLAAEAAQVCRERLKEIYQEGRQGKLEIHATVITTLTQQPMPILEFTELFLDLNDVKEDGLS